MISVKSFSSSGADPLSQLFDALLAHHPPQRVDDVALAAAVGADNGRYTLWELDIGFFAKGFKPCNFKPFKLH
jgi:hypothetical protein